MKIFILTLVLCFSVFPLAQAQLNPQPGPAHAYGEVTDEPICGRLVNTTPYMVTGSIVTEIYVNPEGLKGRHRSNFRIKSERMQEFCTRGPFFEGRKVELTLRTLVPIFSCKTTLGGNIIIKGEPRPDSEGGGYKTWAECLGDSVEIVD